MPGFCYAESAKGMATGFTHVSVVFPVLHFTAHSRNLLRRGLRTFGAAATSPFTEENCQR